MRTAAPLVALAWIATGAQAQEPEAAEPEASSDEEPADSVSARVQQWWSELWSSGEAPSTAPGDAKGASQDTSRQDVQAYLMSQFVGMCAVGSLVDEDRDRVRVVVPSLPVSLASRRFAEAIASHTDACSDADALHAWLVDPALDAAVQTALEDEALRTWATGSEVAAMTDVVDISALFARHEVLMRNLEGFGATFDALSLPAPDGCDPEQADCRAKERTEALVIAVERSWDVLGLNEPFAPMPRRLTTLYRAEVTRVDGASTLEVGDRCMLRLQERTDLRMLTCRATLSCEGQGLYGGSVGGYGSCRRVGDRYIGFTDAMPTLQDRDSTLTVDASKGWAQAGDTYPDWTVEVAFAPVEERDLDAEYTPNEHWRLGRVTEALGAAPVDVDTTCQAQVTGRPDDPLHNCDVRIQCGAQTLYSSRQVCRTRVGDFDGLYDPARSEYDGDPEVTWVSLGDITVRDQPVGEPEAEYSIVIELE